MPSAGPDPLAFAAPDLSIVARRRDSLGDRGRVVVFGALATTSLVLAGGFAIAGAWPVLPYSVLELALVGLAFRWTSRHAGDWERLVVAHNAVLVERRSGGRIDRRLLDRWRVRVDAVAHRTGRRPLVLRCGSEAVEFGAHLPGTDREQVARELRRLTRLA